MYSESYLANGKLFYFLLSFPQFNIYRILRQNCMGSFSGRFLIEVIEFIIMRY